MKKQIIIILGILLFLSIITIKIFAYSSGENMDTNTGTLDFSSGTIEETNTGNTFTGVTLSGSTFSGITLTGGTFSETSLSGATFSGITLSGSLENVIEAQEQNVKYYSGIFTYEGKTYGNSYYDDNIIFPESVLSENNIEIIDKEDYENLNNTTNTKSFRSNKTSLKSGNTNTMSLMSTSNLRDGLVGEWNLNGNANDTSGNGNHGTAYGVTWVDSGRGDGKQVASFNGNSSYILMNNNNEISDYNFSLNTWVKPNNGAVGTIFMFGTRDVSINVGHGSALNLRPNIYYGGDHIVDYSAPYLGGVWYNLILVRDKTNGFKYYVNGNYIGTNSYTGNGGTANGTLALGSDSRERFLNSLFEGEIGNIKLYNRTLSDTEVSTLYREGLGFNNNTQTNTPQYNYSQLTSNLTSTYDYRDKGALNYIQNYYLTHNNSNNTEANTNNAGDPVNLTTGEFDYENTFLKLPGKLPYEFKLSYKNQTYYNGPTGINWDHNYNKYLVEEDNENILYYNGKLGVFRFLKNSNGTYNYNLGLKANLILSGGLLELNYDSGNKEYFNGEKKLSKLQDQYGNSLNFDYTDNLITKVTTSEGKEINYTYDNNRLQEITDPYSNKVKLTYFTGSTNSGSLYDLKEITLENNGKTKTIKFEYSSFGSNETNHNITKLIDSKNQTYVTNTYENDRVKTQNYGSGTITYNYTLNSSGSQIQENTVTDKVGNITDYIYDENGNNTSTTYHSGTGTIRYNYTYNGSGYLLEERKPNGNGVKYYYDNRGNIAEKRQKGNMQAGDNNTNDLVTLYTYNSRNQILTQENLDGITITNTYDTNGNLTQSVTSGLKKSDLTTYTTTKTFEYNNNGELTKSTDGNGNETNYSYSGGLLTQTTSGTGTTGSGTNLRTTNYTYNNYGILKSITDARGNTTNFEITDFNQTGTGITSEGIIKSFIYDENNNKVEENTYFSPHPSPLGEGKKSTNYIYDTLDQITKVTEKYDTNKTKITNIKYDNNGNITEKETGSGAKVKYTYNNFAKVIEERIIKDPSDTSKDLVTTYTYDNNGNITSKTNPNGQTTTYEYDFFGRLTKEIQTDNTYTKLTYNKDNSVSQILKYSSGNTLLSKSQFIYNGNIQNNKIVKEISYKDANNNTSSLITNYDYDKNGNLTKKVDPKGNETNYTYDEFNNLTETTDTLGNKVTNTYDKNNNLLTKTIKQSNNKETTTSYTYDKDNRLISETNNLNKTKTYTYNQLNQISSITDEEGNITNYTYDYIGNVKSESKTNSGTTITKSFTYDERGNNTSITDGNGNITIYEYNNINQLTKTKYPDNKEITYTYDKNGNLKTQTDPNGNVVTNTYDNLNRLTNRSIQTGTGVLGITSESYIYDDLGRLIEINDSDNHKLQFTYDGVNRLITETQSGKVVGYTYDNNNNLTSITNPENKVISYAYDELDRLLSITQSGTTISSYSYTGILNNSITLGNGKNITQGFDGLNRLNGLNNGVKSYNYIYDDVSNITSDNHKNFTYDDIYRLTRVNESLSGGLLENYIYDNAGNRINDGVNNYGINNLNQYLSLSGSTLSGTLIYDNNGNLTNDGTKTFKYDYKNRLVQVESGSGIVVEYKYDVLGRRYEKKTNTETTNYIYSNENILVEYQTKGDIITKKEYINGLGTDEVIAVDQEESILSLADREELTFCEDRVLGFTGSFTKYGWNDIVDRCNNLESSGGILTTNRYYFHKDHLGSVVGISDNLGNIVSEYSYDSYGNYILSGSEIGNDRLFSGREYDKEIGLYYFRARYYSSELGRFVSRDPIGQLDDVNLYAYVGNNPVNYTDPTGLGHKPILTLGDLGTAFKESFGILKTNAPSEYDGNKYEVEHGEYGEELILGASLIPWGPGKAGKVEKISKDVEKNIEKITNKYGIGKCKDCAKELENFLKKEGIDFKKKVLEGGRDGIIFSEKIKETISTSGYHIGIEVKDKVYDNINKKGIKLDEWLDDLGVGYPTGPTLK